MDVFIDLNSVFYVIETLGIVSFAISGMMLAKRKDFDIVGVYIIGWVTSFGGGTIRDMMLDRQPLHWISHSEYPLMLLGLAILFSLIRRVRIQKKWLLVPDAMGMALFAVTTAQMTVNMGLPIIIVGMLSAIVPTFGGVIRDSLCQEIPQIFRSDSTLYASLAFGGGILYSFFVINSIFSPTMAMILSAIIIFILRILAHMFHWRLRWPTHL
ncbi:MAG: trimeric intracellular cation channel family protein [Candidatus Marinamargulisbacteria bacterium]